MGYDPVAWRWCCCCCDWCYAVAAAVVAAFAGLERFKAIRVRVAMDREWGGAIRTGRERNADTTVLCSRFVSFRFVMLFFIAGMVLG